MKFPNISDPRPFNTISVIGLGYIGLPTAAVIASRNINIAGIDVNESTVNTVNKGEIHIVEPLLGEMVKSAVQDGYLIAYTKPVSSDAFLIAVPTPITKDKKADLSYVLSAARSIAPVLKKGDLVILESTSPVGATEQLTQVLAQERSDLVFPSYNTNENECDIHIAYCPERVLPGKVIEELVNNDRSIGGMSDACTQRAIALYKLFVKGELIPTDTRSAELCKLTENAFRDVNIAFANELANVCNEIDMSVWEVIKLANRHPRVNILTPGAGVGGHCIAVDPWFIAESAPNHTPVIQAARRVNDGRPDVVLNMINSAIETFIAKNKEKSISDITIACYGLSYKPNIDDLRESPALSIAQKLEAKHNGALLLVEPNITTLPKMFSNAQLTNYEEALSRADIHVLLVTHAQFKISPPQGSIIVDVTGSWA